MEMENELQWLLLFSNGLIVISIFVYVILSFVVAAPYGRYGSSKWGPELPARLAWFVQELPSFLVPVWCIFQTDADKLTNTTNCVILGLFLTHYFQRALIFPFLLRGGKPTPFVTFVLALVYCMFNGYLQGRYLTRYAVYTTDQWSSPRCLLGIAMFASGMAINIHSDHILRNLRKPGETGYKIPQGGMFEYISGANFFGEMLEWTGFAVAAWNPPAAAFAIFTVSNIGPRAQSHHRWYQEKFKEAYPKSRKAVIPFLF